MNTAWHICNCDLEKRSSIFWQENYSHNLIRWSLLNLGSASEITLECDVILIQKTAAILNKTTRLVEMLNRPDVPVRWDWWSAGRALLQMTLPLMNPSLLVYVWLLSCSLAGQGSSHLEKDKHRFTYASHILKHLPENKTKLTLIPLEEFKQWSYSSHRWSHIRVFSDLCSEIFHQFWVEENS